MIRNIKVCVSQSLSAGRQKFLPPPGGRISKRNEETEWTRFLRNLTSVTPQPNLISLQPVQNFRRIFLMLSTPSLAYPHLFAGIFSKSLCIEIPVQTCFPTIFLVVQVASVGLFLLSQKNRSTFSHQNVTSCSDFRI